MKLFFGLLLCLGSILSCTEKKEFFYQHQRQLEDIVGFCLTHKVELGLQKGTGAIFLDSSLLVHPLYNGLYRNQLDSFFKLNLFNQISLFEDGNIEFQIHFEKNNLLMTETKKYYVYSPQNDLSIVYQHWATKQRLDTHWWYLENTDAQY